MLVGVASFFLIFTGIATNFENELIKAAVITRSFIVIFKMFLEFRRESRDDKFSLYQYVSQEELIDLARHSFSQQATTYIDKVKEIGRPLIYLEYLALEDDGINEQLTAAQEKIYGDSSSL